MPPPTWMVGSPLIFAPLPYRLDHFVLCTTTTSTTPPPTATTPTTEMLSARTSPTTRRLIASFAWDWGGWWWSLLDVHAWIHSPALSLSLALSSALSSSTHSPTTPPTPTPPTNLPGILLAILIFFAAAQLLQPYTRYFFADDQSIAYPHTIQETVPTWLLFVSLFILPGILLGIQMLTQITGPCHDSANARHHRGVLPVPKELP